MNNFYKKLLQGLFLLLWIFIIARPSINAFLQKDSKVILTNLTEEEHKEHDHGKKEKESELFYIDYSFTTIKISELNYDTPFVYCATSIYSRTQDIQVPPPKEIA
jgi:hypothetical protein